MVDFGGVAHTSQPCRSSRLEVSIWVCMGATNTRVFPDMTYMPECSFINVYSTCKKWKKIIAPFSRKIDQQLFFVWWQPLKIAISQKWKKRLGILMKNSQKPNFIPIGPVGSELWLCTERQTHRHTSAHEKTTFLDSWGHKTCRSIKSWGSNF